MKRSTSQSAKPSLSSKTQASKIVPSPTTGAEQANIRPPLDEVLEIIRLMGETKLAEISLETPELKLALRKQPLPPTPPSGSANGIPLPIPVASPMAMPYPGILPTSLPPGPPPPLSGNGEQKTENRVAASKPEKAPPPAPQKTYHKILSPMAGTFYRAPSPNSPPYVNEGDLVTPGKTVCIVEAMKLMNEIKADKAGKIVKIHGVNAKPVEKGTVLFEIDTETTA
ncbi:MAG: Biotin carboxyl carrier protein of acetyl-CoA carboxylase [Candidatus Ozemobacter sibiricus]|jgi:acetyl-CoA carboxylase biotin carboxyl carrier protein|uniref:Biotin carboxyl carrier protein of acetyl-CoA carboxylase n=1 Tax=Candidatus Ozemobacter sibiricus TaxID=2268124 RepID=A0A367ZLS6_9BACT|nr:MAG: Biotin carboxyl carrier protein of acetyl-CoA carboxylase [Candidatus Ozemobacter sibiricus]